MDSKRPIKWVRANKSQNRKINARRSASVKEQAERLLNNVDQQIKNAPEEGKNSDELFREATINTGKANQELAELKKQASNMKSSTPAVRDALVEKTIKLRLAQYMERKLQSPTDTLLRNEVSKIIISALENKDNHLFKATQAPVEAKSGFLNDNDEWVSESPEQKAAAEQKEYERDKPLYAKRDKNNTTSVPQVPFPHKTNTQNTNEKDCTRQINAISERISQYENQTRLTEESRFFRGSNRRSVDPRVAEIKNLISSAGAKNETLFVKLTEYIKSASDAIPQKFGKKPADILLQDLNDLTEILKNTLKNTPRRS